MGAGMSKNTHRNFQKLSCHALLGPGKPSGAHLLGTLSLLHSIHMSILLSLIDGVPPNKAPFHDFWGPNLSTQVANLDSNSNPVSALNSWERESGFPGVHSLSNQLWSRKMVALQETWIWQGALKKRWWPQQVSPSIEAYVQNIEEGNPSWTTTNYGT